MNELRVMYGPREVGRLREESGRIYFAYAMDWLSDGFPISPRSLPLEDRAFTARDDRFDGLFGVFADSLPDGWGTYITIKALRRKGISYFDLSPLDRLSLIGSDGLGALTYIPSSDMERTPDTKDLDSICGECMSMIEDDNGIDIDDIFLRAGSTGGARPKVNHIIDGEEWMVKLRERNDPPSMGRMEYEYNQAAMECGIAVPESRLIPSGLCDGYFASKRFDRIQDKRVHMITLDGLLEVPRDMPLLDYHTFLQATRYITGSQEEVIKAYRLACFNVLSGNMDDHSKNFAYLYSEERKGYVLSPAYDLTRTAGLKEHEMSCMGGGDPDTDDLLSLADVMNIPKRKATGIIDTIEDVVRNRLSEWL